MDLGTHKIKNELFLLSHRKMTGVEYMLSEVMEPNLFVIRKQKRDGPEKVTPMLAYYILDGSIYQAPQLCNVFAARVVSFDILFFYHVLTLYSTTMLSPKVSFDFSLVTTILQKYCKNWFSIQTLCSFVLLNMK